VDNLRFDAWPRRRIGLVAGGLTAGLGLLAPVRGDAKKTKKRKKVRCRKLLQSCEHQGKEERCCGGLNCDTVSGQPGLACCFGRQHRCESAGQCCGGVLCDEVEGLDGDRCCANGGDFCVVDADCCFGSPCSNNQCAFLSDQSLKANVGSVDPTDMVQRLRELPISTWNYTSDDPSVRHIGPMAQDFAAAFGVGADDRHIHPIDGQGVALAAIQGLAREIAALRAENARLASRIGDLEIGARQSAPPAASRETA
jgi:hypothetical protein